MKEGVTWLSQDNMESTIRDIGLAPQGQLKIDWVQAHMPVLNTLREEFEKTQPFQGKKVTICLHLEAKTAYLAKVVQAGGAEVTVAASNPLSTQDDVVAALVAGGVHAHAWYGATDEEYHQHLHKALDFEPDYIIDDGGDLVSTLHKERRELLPKVLGGAEETTTGILRLRAMEKNGELAFPMMAVNDAEMKYLFDNRYGTGQSVWDGIMRTTNLVVAGKTVCVVGYGWCGKGVALRAKGLGARVIICEVNPIKANEAWMDGFEVMPMLAAAPLGDFFVTVTGNKNVISGEHFQVMKDGAILANAGHFDVEVNKVQLAAMAQSCREVRRNIEEYLLQDGRKIYLLAEGRLVNLAAGDGHPAEVMDMTFALQALALHYLATVKTPLEPKVYSVPTEMDMRVAELKLKTLGLSIDQLSEEQKSYLASWQHS
ncbi:adenosylhomocysteinase [Desulfitobacterium sp. LBE]|uniref:Adenosylhomocysteinase n=2 Tax=Desulfitobacteriaceae TaxID=2937909 RepID=A0A098B0R9_DESHA|nr:adenosylhomocysteinase [Desulfitobacterium hafniense]TWH56111.1 adenosylhomocysteinase [Desulfitobacterium sp. LBE]CDX01962.1 Adenosylhomocysteinase [Desulfitobacterium hafniense]